jgi:hypothetical protein
VTTREHLEDMIIKHRNYKKGFSDIAKSSHWVELRLLVLRNSFQPESIVTRKRCNLRRSVLHNLANDDHIMDFHPKRK